MNFNILATAFCYDLRVLKSIRILAYVITIVKILVPIFLIISGSIALFHAIMDADDGSIKKAVKSLIIKFFVGAAIFFIPMIFETVFNLIDGYQKIQEDNGTRASACVTCLTSVSKCNKLISTREYLNSGN